MYGRSSTIVGLATLALAALTPSLARADGCESAISAAAAALAHCRLRVESIFADSSDTDARAAALKQCADRFAATFTRLQARYGGTCMVTESSSTFNAYLGQSTDAVAAAAGGAPLTTFPDICTSQSGVTTLAVHNNCLGPESVTVSAGLAGQASPACLQNLPAGGAPPTVYLTGNTNYAFWTGTYGSSTLFEISVSPGGSAQDNFDISFNKGFDIGMTIVAPAGTMVPYVIATDATAPGAYQLPANQPSCWDAPCLSPNYNATTGKSWDLYLCNRTGDVNTPGPCGCTVCPCAVSRGGPGCNWQTVTCMGLPIPGNNGCPVNCPGT